MKVDKAEQIYERLKGVKLSRVVELSKYNMGKMITIDIPYIEDSYILIELIIAKDIYKVEEPFFAVRYRYELEISNRPKGSKGLNQTVAPKGLSEFGMLSVNRYGNSIRDYILSKSCRPIGVGDDKWLEAVSVLMVAYKVIVDMGNFKVVSI